MDVQKEKYKEIKLAAEVAGESINSYIKKAISERMERENISPIVEQPTHLTQKPEQTTLLEEKQKKHYKPFTAEDAKKINLLELLKNVRYQFDIALTFGENVLIMLLEKARQQETKQIT